MTIWEFPPRKIVEIPSYNVGVVLTGGIGNEKAADGIYLSAHGDRIWQALRLYKAKKINKVLISGGELFEEQGYTENDLAKRYLIENGVQGSDIFQDKKSKNTYQNAVFTKELLAKNKLSDSLILITSSFHMYRAKACFQKQGLVAMPFPSMILSRKGEFSFYYLIPSAATFNDFSSLVNEWSGLLIYKIMNYV